jgi:hypothetical protein
VFVLGEELRTIGQKLCVRVVGMRWGMRTITAEEAEKRKRTLGLLGAPEEDRVGG